MLGLIKVQGGTLIGMGHVVRSLELAEELENQGVKVIGFHCNDDPQSLKRINSKGFPTWVQQTNARNGDEELAELIIGEKLDILIIDHPGDFSKLCRNLKTANPHLFIVALDHFILENECLDVIVNLFNHNPILRAPTSNRVQYYEGVQYGIISKGFDKYIARSKTIPSQAKNVMVSFGGSDPKENTFRVLEALMNDIPLEMSFHFVLGPNFLNNERVRHKASQTKLKLCFYEDPTNIEKLMYNCDLGLVGAGTTMLEMASLGTPSIIIAQNINESKFAGYFAGLGAAEHLGLADEVQREQVREAIIGLGADQHARQRMSMAGKRWVDGRGRERIAQLIRKNYNLSRERHG